MYNFLLIFRSKKEIIIFELFSTANNKKDRMSMKKGLKTTLVAVVLLSIVGLLTMASGMLAKLFMKANSCHQTKLLLFVSGVVLSFMIAGLGYILALVEKDKKEEDKYFNKIDAWIDREQYRYAAGKLGALF